MFMPRGRTKNLSSAISFRDCESTLKIRMPLIPVNERGEIQRNKHSVTFSWAEWIHTFEACMKVLTYDYGDGELREVHTDEDSLSQSKSESMVLGDIACGSNYDSKEHHNPTDEESPLNAEIEASGAEEDGTQGESHVVHESDAIVGETEDGIER
ncbi:hypothetical protein FGB62_27g15 [Gracilaria domingensis]|nr:hypothetical protein FGB62_27g15 [Gracilaria domingensis]